MDHGATAIVLAPLSLSLNETLGRFQRNNSLLSSSITLPHPRLSSVPCQVLLCRNRLFLLQNHSSSKASSSIWIQPSNTICKPKTPVLLMTPIDPIFYALPSSSSTKFLTKERIESTLKSLNVLPPELISRTLLRVQDEFNVNEWAIEKVLRVQKVLDRKKQEVAKSLGIIVTTADSEKNYDEALTIVGEFCPSWLFEELKIHFKTPMLDLFATSPSLLSDVSNQMTGNTSRFDHRCSQANLEKKRKNEVFKSSGKKKKPLVAGQKKLSSFFKKK